MPQVGKEQKDAPTLTRGASPKHPWSPALPAPGGMGGMLKIHAGVRVWFSFLSRVLKLTVEEKQLRAVFRKVDEDNSGQVSIDEIVALVEDWACNSRAPPTHNTAPGAPGPGARAPGPGPRARAPGPAERGSGLTKCLEGVATPFVRVL